jgi:hypothetical protein
VALGTALVLIFAVWLLIKFPWAVLRLVGGLVGLVVVGIAAFYISEERDRPRREREAVEARVRQAQALARVQLEEAALYRDRETYQSSDRWIGVAVDTKHCRYYMDVETMTIGSNSVHVWIKVETPVLEPGMYLPDTCLDYSGPRQVSFACTGQHVGGAWSFAPGMISESVLRWIQKSPWCAKVIADAEFAREQREKARAEWQANSDQQRSRDVYLSRDRAGTLHFSRSPPPTAPPQPWRPTDWSTGR